MKSVTVCALLAVCDCLLAEPVFNRSDVMVGVHPHAVVAGDFDGDHGEDIAVITEEGVFTILNRGYSYVRPLRTEAISGSDLVTGFYAPFVGVADFNRDGLDDLATNGVLLLSRGDGSFRVARRDLAVVMGMGDFDGDGKADLLQSDPDPGIEPGHGVRVLLGNGDGTFRPGATISTVGVEQVVVADFNHDGWLDVAVMPHFGPGTLLVFLGQGDGAFSSGIQTQIPFALEWLYLAADFNGDGIADLTAPGGIALGKGDGTFQSPIGYPQGRVGVPIAVADFQRDGRVDLVTSDRVGSVFVFPGKGDGSLLSPTVQSVGWGVMPRAAVVDVEYPYVDSRRGYHADLVTTSGSSNSITILLYWGETAGPMLRAVSAASGTAIVAPGSLATLFGPTPATGSVSATPPWPTRLGGLSLDVEGRLARLLYVSPTQINFQVPLEFSSNDDGYWNLTIADEKGKTYDAGGLHLNSVAPGLFLVVYNYGPPAGSAIRVEPDGTQVPIPLYTCGSSDTGRYCDFAPIPLSTAGDRPIYVSLFGTGFRGATPANVTCEVNGVQVPVVYAGPQETPGVDQINIRLLPTVLEGFSGETMTVIIRMDGVPANSALIAVR